METLVMTEEISMDELLAESDGVKSGATIEGTVVEHVENQVLVNVGLKQEAQISFNEFGGNIPAVGTKIDVLILRVSGPEGRPVVSWRQARERKNWDKLFQAFQEKTPVEGKITQRIKGGVQVDIGLLAFMPASQIDDHQVGKPEEWVGKTVQVIILEMDKSKGNVLVSRRKILEGEKAAKRAITLQSIQVDQVVEGKVTGLTNFGAFVDIGGIEGLLHVSDMSWSHVGNPKSVVKVGDILQVKILKYDAATQKVSLGRKHLLPHPWEGLEKKYPLNSVVKGKVTGLAAFGAFVEIEPGIEGLIHLSELSWTDHVKSAKDILKSGQPVEVKIIAIDRANEKISLSLKRTGASPWDVLMVEHPVGSQIEGEVTHIAKFGAFVKVAQGIEALLKIQDFSWTDKVQSPSDIVKVGDKIKAVVLDINPREEKMSIGVKQLSNDPMKNLRVGQAVTGTVSKITDYGMVIKLESGIEGFVKNSELFNQRSIFQEEKRDRNAPQQPNPYKEGDSITAAVAKINKKDRKLDLSVRRFEAAEEKELLKKYSGQSNTPTLGDAMGWNDEE